MTLRFAKAESFLDLSFRKSFKYRIHSAEKAILEKCRILQKSKITLADSFKRIIITEGSALP